MQSVDAASARERPARGGANFTDWGSVQLERTNWLSPDRIPLAELTIVEGPGGVGKTTAMLDIGARISRGLPMPDGAAPFDGPRDVLLVADEDRTSILKARLMAAGADMARIHHIASMTSNQEVFSLPSHGQPFFQAVRDTGSVFALIDGLFSYLDAGLKSGVTEDVRKVLFPLGETAHLTGAAVIAIRHWGKAAREASSRGLGSIDITNFARSVIAIARHPHDDSGPRIVAVAKSNLGQDHTRVRSLSFTLTPTIVGEGDIDVSVARVTWGDEVEITAEELANTTVQTAEEKTEVARNARRIRELVAEAGEAGAPCSALQKMLLGEGCSRATFFRAVKRARVESGNRSVPGAPRRAVYRLLTGGAPQQSHARDSAIIDTLDAVDTISPQQSQVSQMSRIGGDETVDAVRPVLHVPATSAECKFHIGRPGGSCGRCGVEWADHP